MQQKATFAAGCFWGVEETFRKLEGVVGTAVGYTGGQLAEPSYKDVCSGTTGHAEAIEIDFDPERIEYGELLGVFWGNHDPTTLNRQGPDAGTQYRSGIFYHSEQQRTQAEESKRALEGSGHFTRPIVTEIVPAQEFHRAEEYHQRYLEKRGQSQCGL